MSPAMRAALIEYAEARKAAAPNAAIMCGNPSERDVNGCAERMTRVELARNALDGFRDAEGQSAELAAFFAAHDDRGCGRCWASSIRRLKHPECMEKIKRWFRAREALQACAESLAEGPP